MTRVAAILVALVALLSVGAGERPLLAAGGESAEVVVLLRSPALALAPDTAQELAAEQRAFRRELASAVPDARVEWRYRLVANGFSLSLPSTDVPRLKALAGVRDVLPAASYGPQLDTTLRQIGAPAVWGPKLDTAGQGVKIGIIDSGVDPAHPFFDPASYTMPPGFPKGQRRFTTAKVIVAKVFAPRSATAPSARLAFSEDDSSHGTHVAGIAAGNPATRAGGRVVSGVAPRAYIGNYKVFVQTDSGISPNANSPAIVAAIEAAVADGMDVINFSGGEPEIEPSRDIVARALDAAAAAGVVPVVAAGNDYDTFGSGSVSSPANSARAISVAAVETSGIPPSSTHAGFSSVGPTTISLRLKPDVSAPGVDVLSSVINGWGSFSGTSMAAPHVAGGAALLRQRHPDWTVDEIKSALVQSGSDATTEDGVALAPSFQGGGVVALQQADRPLLFASPTSLSLGLLRAGESASGSIALEDAGGGAGTWTVDVARSAESSSGGSLTLPSSVDVPGTLSYQVTLQAGAKSGDLAGYIELRRGTDVRRVPFWGRASASVLKTERAVALTRPGVYRGTTAGQPARVSRYRYPDNPRGVGVTTTLRGPERLYSLQLTERVANFGVVVTSRGQGSRVEPRVVTALDENRLTGYAGLPINANPYLDQFGDGVLAAGALSPAPGEYGIVLDSGSRAGAGSFTFRYWVDDVTPPSLRLPARTIRAGADLEVAATDAGAGVYPESILALIDGERFRVRYSRGIVSIATAALGRGTHRLRLRVSDYQEAKNTENVARILPNTRWLTATFRVR